MENKAASLKVDSSVVVEHDTDQLPALLLSIHEDQLADVFEDLSPDFWYLWSNGGGGGGCSS